MLNINKIAHKAILSTSRVPRWWILALFQLIAFSFIGEFVRPRFLRLPFILWLAASAVVLTLVTVWLWLDIDAQNSGRAGQKPLKAFLKICLTSGAVLFCAVAINIAVRLAYRGWVFFALVSSLVWGTAALAMLYAVLCGQGFGAALTLAADTWNKKISLAAIVSFVLILCHAVAFALLHSILGRPRITGEFELLSHSATIWILFLALILGAVFFAAVINSFLVLLFLEIIRRKKDPEATEMEIVKRAILEPNS